MDTERGVYTGVNTDWASNTTHARSWSILCGKVSIATVGWRVHGLHLTPIPRDLLISVDRGGRIYGYHSGFLFR